MCSRILLIGLFGVMAIGAVISSQAQEATPSAESPFASLGLPEITITATDEGLMLSQRRVPAGRYLITLDNQSEDPYLAVGIARLMENFRSRKTSCPSLLPPACIIWYPQTYLPGGVSGQSPQAVVDLPAGKYGLWGTWAESDEPEAMLKVSGDPDAVISGPEPEGAAIIVTKGEDGYGFAIRVEGQLHPGPQIIKIVNAADQPLSIAAAQDPEWFNGDEVISTPMSVAASDNATPLDTFNSAQFGQVMYTEPQSVSSQQWVVLELTPGSVYVAAFVPDPTTIHEGTSGWYAATAITVPVAEL